MSECIAEQVYIPKSTRLPRSVREDMTIRVWDIGTAKTVEWVLPYVCRNHYCFPRQYGIRLAETLGISLKDTTSPGFPALDECSSILLREEQVPWVDAIVRKLQELQYDVFAQANTGFGKTTCALEVARRLGRTTLVLVDQEFLKNQWAERATEFLGLDESEIGVIQGPNCDFQGKQLVIGMVQSVYRTEVHSALREYFGLVVLDEAHVTGAEQFSGVLSKFNSRYRLAISATPDRKDGLQKILDMHLGTVSVQTESSHRKSKLRVLKNPYSVYSEYANSSPKSGVYLNEIAADTLRNHLLAQAIAKLYRQDRTILAISDRTEHLSDLKELLMLYSVPNEDIGIVAGTEYYWGYVRNDKATTTPEGLEDGAEFTPIKLDRVSKRTPKRLLEERKEQSRIILATYGMFSKGVDVPRLDTGIDCTPRSSSVQVHGRILRVSPGKKTPLWVTVRDIWSYKAEFQFLKRMKDYLESNVEVYQWHLEKGVKKADPDEILWSVAGRAKVLKRSEIITQSDGNYTVLIPYTETK